MRQKDQRDSYHQEKENLKALFCRITYAGTQTHILFMNSTKSLKCVTNKPFILKNIYKTTKISIYFNTKCKVPYHLKSNLTYKFSCPAGNARYIDKADWNFRTQRKEHCGLDKNSPYSIILLSIIFTSTALTYIISDMIMLLL